MMMLKIFILSLILKISLATMPMDCSAAVNILGPTVDKMASSIRREANPLVRSASRRSRYVFFDLQIHYLTSTKSQTFHQMHKYSIPLYLLLHILLHTLTQSYYTKRNARTAGVGVRAVRASAASSGLSSDDKG